MIVNKMTTNKFAEGVVRLLADVKDSNSRRYNNIFGTYNTYFSNGDEFTEKQKLQLAASLPDALFTKFMEYSVMLKWRDNAEFFYNAIKKKYKAPDAYLAAICQLFHCLPHSYSLGFNVTSEKRVKSDAFIITFISEVLDKVAGLTLTPRSKKPIDYKWTLADVFITPFSLHFLNKLFLYSDRMPPFIQEKCIRFQGMRAVTKLGKDRNLSLADIKLVEGGGVAYKNTLFVPDDDQSQVERYLKTIIKDGAGLLSDAQIRNLIKRYPRFMHMLSESWPTSGYQLKDDFIVTYFKSLKYGRDIYTEANKELFKTLKGAKSISSVIEKDARFALISILSRKNIYNEIRVLNDPKNSHLALALISDLSLRELTNANIHLYNPEFDDEKGTMFILLREMGNEYSISVDVKKALDIANDAAISAEEDDLLPKGYWNDLASIRHTWLEKIFKISPKTYFNIKKRVTDLDKFWTNTDRNVYELIATKNLEKYVLELDFSYLKS